MGLHSSWRSQSSRKLDNTNQISKSFIKNVYQETNLTWRAMSLIVLLSTHMIQFSFKPTSIQGASWACFSVLEVVTKVQMLVFQLALQAKLETAIKNCGLQRLTNLLGKQNSFQLGEWVLIKTYSEGPLGPTSKHTLKKPIFDTCVFHSHQGLKNCWPD